jgi:hypothetical protein
MRKYALAVRASRALLKTAIALCAMSIWFSLPASAQNGAPGGRSAQAVLHIRINIVPVMQAPRMPEKPQTGIVSYDVPVNRTPVDVIEDVQVLSGTAVGSGTGDSVILKTRTIVAK